VELDMDDLEGATGGADAGFGTWMRDMGDLFGTFGKSLFASPNGDLAAKVQDELGSQSLRNLISDDLLKGLGNPTDGVADIPSFVDFDIPTE
jgi:hypothetical protein